MYGLMNYRAILVPGGYVPALAGIESVWALALEAYEAAREQAEEHGREINSRDFTAIRPAGSCFYSEWTSQSPGRVAPGERSAERRG